MGAGVGSRMGKAKPTWQMTEVGTKAKTLGHTVGQLNPLSNATPTLFCCRTGDKNGYRQEVLR